MADINPIQRALSLFNLQANASINEMQDVYSALTGMAYNDVQTLQDIGENSALIDQTKQNAEMQAMQGKVAKAAELGIKPGAATDALTALAGEINVAYAEKSAALSEIQKKQSVGLTDNPIQWLINQFTVQDDIAKHDAADAKLSGAAEQYQRVNQMTQSAAVTQSALATSVTAATIQASGDNIRAQAQLLSNKSLKDGLIFNATGIKQILDISSQQLSAVFSLFNAEQSNARLNQEMESAARLREEWEWKKQQKEMLEQGDNEILKQINMGGRMRMGAEYKELRPGTVEAANAIALLKSNSPVGKLFQDDYLSGAQGVIAANPAQAVERLKTQVIRLPPAQVPVRGVLEQALQDVQKMPGFDPKNIPAVQASINARTKEIIDAQLRNINPNDETNVFNIPSLSAVVAAVPELQKSPLVQKVLSPRMQAGDNLNNPDDVFQLVAKAIQSGQISYTEALDLPYLYQRGVALNLAARNLENFGITSSNNNSKYSYRTRVTTNPASPFAGKDVVDLTKVDAYGRALNIYLSKQAVVEMNKARNKFLGDVFDYEMFPATTMGGQIIPEFGRRVQENSQNYGSNISRGGQQPLPGVPGGRQ